MTATVIRLANGILAVQAKCAVCSKVIVMPCRLENGEQFEPDERALMWAKMVVCDDCAERERQQREESDLRASASERIKASGIPKSFMNLSFEDMDIAGDRARVVAAAQAWADADDGGILLHGPPGTGKTRLAATAAWRRLLRAPVTWCSVSGLITDLGRSFTDAERWRAVNVLRGRGALILDDIDKVRATEFARDQLFEAVNQRVSANAPLLVTSNASPAALADRFGAAIVSRLVGLQVYELGGHDRRLSKGRV